MLNKVIELIIKECHKSDPVNIFRYLVDRRMALGYYDTIAKPICLEQMNQKAKRQEYLSIKAFKDDMALMRKNAEQYNGVNNAISDLARSLEAQAENACNSEEHRERITEASQKIKMN